MEFSDISLTKDSSLLLHAFHSRIKENQTILWFLKILKKKTRKLEFIHEWRFVEGKNEGSKPDKTILRRLEKPRLKMPFKNSLSGKQLRYQNHRNRMSVFALPLVDFQVWTGGKSIYRKYQVLSLFPPPSSPSPHPSSPSPTPLPLPPSLFPSPLSSCLVTTVYTTIHLPSFMAIW